MTNLVDLVGERWDEAHTLLIRGKLGHVLHQPFDDFNMSLTKGRHDARHFAVVHAVDVGMGADQQLDNIEMSTYTDGRTLKLVWHRNGQQRSTFEIDAMVRKTRGGLVLPLHASQSAEFPFLFFVSIAAPLCADKKFLKLTLWLPSYFLYHSIQQIIFYTLSPGTIFFHFQTSGTKLFLTLYLSAGHWLLDFIYWKKVFVLCRNAVYLFWLENLIPYKMLKMASR